MDRLIFKNLSFVAVCALVGTLGFSPIAKAKSIMCELRQSENRMIKAYVGTSFASAHLGRDGTIIGDRLIPARPGHLFMQFTVFEEGGTKSYQVELPLNGISTLLEQGVVMSKMPWPEEEKPDAPWGEALLNIREGDAKIDYMGRSLGFECL